MYQMTDREIAEITAGYRDGIIAAAVIAPVSVIIRHAIVLPAYCANADSVTAESER